MPSLTLACKISKELNKPVEEIFIYDENEEKIKESKKSASYKIRLFFCLTGYFVAFVFSFFLAGNNFLGQEFLWSIISAVLIIFSYAGGGENIALLKKDERKVQLNNKYGNAALGYLVNFYVAYYLNRTIILKHINFNLDLLDVTMYSVLLLSWFFSFVHVKLAERKEN